MAFHSELFKLPNAVPRGYEQTRTGVGIMIFKEDKILMAKRKSAHGEGMYSFPGGHLEYMESFEECALREIKEECGVEVKNLEFLFVANLKMYAPKHFTHIGLTAHWASGEPQIMEPDRHEVWGWYSIYTGLPEPIFEPCRLSVDAWLKGIHYYDDHK
jgi:8-oxo-dGTP diphosphatase